MNPNSPISAIMTTDLITVRPDDFLFSVTKVFEENNFHHLPVVENGNKLVGIISREDFQKMTYFFKIKKPKENGLPEQKAGLRARDLMTPYPLSIDPDDAIGLAADIVLANRFHALPVIEDDELVGLVTSHDLIAYAFKSPIAQRNVESMR